MFGFRDFNFTPHSFVVSNKPLIEDLRHFHPYPYPYLILCLAMAVRMSNSELLAGAIFCAAILMISDPDLIYCVQ